MLGIGWQRSDLGEPSGMAGWAETRRCLERRGSRRIRAYGIRSSRAKSTGTKCLRSECHFCLSVKLRGPCTAPTVDVRFGTTWAEIVHKPSESCGLPDSYARLRGKSQLTFLRRYERCQPNGSSGSWHVQVDAANSIGRANEEASIAAPAESPDRVVRIPRAVTGLIPNTTVRWPTR